MCLTGEQGATDYVIYRGVPKTDAMAWIAYFPFHPEVRRPVVGSYIETGSLPRGRVRELLDEAKIPAEVEEVEFKLAKDQPSYPRTMEMPDCALIFSRPKADTQFVVLRTLDHLEPQEGLNRIRDNYHAGLAWLS